MKKIILINGVARCGKDTLATFILNNIKELNLTGEIVPNAKTVKHIAKEQFNWNGEKDLIGRQLLIDITNAGYNYDKNFWEKATENYFKSLNNTEYIIIPDWRYRATFDYFKNSGYEVTTIFLKRDFENDLKHLKDDISEKPFEDSLYNIEIYNKLGTVSNLKKLCKENIGKILGLNSGF